MTIVACFKQFSLAICGVLRTNSVTSFIVNVACSKSVELKVNHLKYVTTIFCGAWLVSLHIQSGPRGSKAQIHFVVTFATEDHE